MKEELTDMNTKAIERIKIGSNTSCIREDPAKEKVVFSQESNQAFFEMGSVKLIELKTPMTQMPIMRNTTFLKGQLFADAGST